MGQRLWLDLDPARGHPLRVVGTLGPAGTSSEYAARHLWTCGPENRPEGPVVRLYDTYEEAAEALAAGSVSHLVVANAYAGVNAFYMDPSFELVGAFVLDTPHYGLARARSHRVPRMPAIATHPAPRTLVQELLPERYEVGKVVLSDSTSAAALAVTRRAVDLALTTAPSAALYDLEFVSRTRTILMLWSVFAARPRT